VIFDTHAHYDDERFDGDRAALLSSLPGAGVGGVVVPSTEPGNLEAVLSLAGAYDFIRAAAGFHPHSAAGVTEDDFAALEAIVRDAGGHNVVAVGECGLDYHYDNAPRDRQREVFARQLALARDAGLPVLVHDREAHADCLALIGEHPGVSGVFHCYSGDAAMVGRVVELGFMVSFAGSVTFKNAHGLRGAAAAVPDGRLLVETDAPYLAPVPHRGKRCDSRMIAEILEVLAEVRRTTRPALEQLTWENAVRVFNGQLTMDN